MRRKCVRVCVCMGERERMGVHSYCGGLKIYALDACVLTSLDKMDPSFVADVHNYTWTKLKKKKSRVSRTLC